MATKIYLGTWFLRAFVSRKSSKRSDVMPDFKKLQSNSFEAVIPQIVLGEAFATIMRGYDEPNSAYTVLKKLYEMLHKIIDSGSCIPTITVDIIEKAKKLKKDDSRLKDTDAIITAHALLNSDSQKLLTAVDTTMLNSRVIKDEEEIMRNADQRNSKLKIVDGL